MFNNSGVQRSTCCQAEDLYNRTAVEEKKSNLYRLTGLPPPRLYNCKAGKGEPPVQLYRRSILCSCTVEKDQ